MAHVDKAHSASTKNNPSQTFAILMSLKHGNSLFLNRGVKNGRTIAVNQRARAMGNPRRLLGFSRFPDRPHFYLMG